MGLVINWTWDPASDACARCTTMPVVTTYRPRRPHPNCDCKIDFFVDNCEKDKEETTEKQIGSHDERVGSVSKGGSTTISVTDTATSTDKWNLGFDNGGIGGEEGQQKSTTSSNTFTHSDETEESEEIFAQYDDFEVTKLEHHDCSIGGGFWQRTKHYEERRSGFFQGPSSKFP